MKRLKQPSNSLILLLIGATLLSTSACINSESENSNSNTPASIDLAKAYANREEIVLSSFAQAIAYVPLETKTESLIGRGPVFQITNDHIISSASNQVLVFNKADGEFIREIGTRGEGPGEYRVIDRYFNEKNSLTYVRSNTEHFGLNITGEIAERFVTPLADSVFISSFTHLSDSTFVGFHGNYNCEQKYKLIFFNKKGEITKTVENQFSCKLENPNSFHFLGREAQFPKLQNKVWFKETFNDTIFEITNNILVPKIIVSHGNKGIPYEDRIMKSSVENQYDFFKSEIIDITKNQLFLKLTTKGQTFNGIFNRETRETQLSDIGNAEMHGFVNDFDNFLPFVPQYATDNNQLVGYIEAPDVLAWFKENPEKAEQLPPHLKKLGEMKSDDNPLVMIVDLKD